MKNSYSIDDPNKEFDFDNSAYDFIGQSNNIELIEDCNFNQFEEVSIVNFILNDERPKSSKNDWKEFCVDVLLDHNHSPPVIDSSWMDSIFN